MKGFSFIHCSDIHLGHKQFNDSLRALDFVKAFRQVTGYALQEAVDFVLIGGDFFHKRAINAETLGQAIDILDPLRDAGIPVIAIEGNHDKAFYQDHESWLNFLNDQGYLCLLKPRYQDGRLIMEPWDHSQRRGSWYDLPGARVYGVGYLGITTAMRLQEVYDQLPEKEEGYAILLLHAAVNRLLGNDLGGIKKEIILPFCSKVDYLALGHIHSRYEIDDWIYNPGSLECCHLDEYGPKMEKGFYHVTVTEEGQKVHYIPSRYRTVIRCAVDLSNSSGPESAREIIMLKLKEQEISNEAIIHILLEGKIEYNPLSIDIALLTEEIKNILNAIYVEILNNTNIPEAYGIRSGGTVKREEIETMVFAQLLSQEQSWQDSKLQEAVLTVQRLKEMALTGDNEQEIIDFLLLQGQKLITDFTGMEINGVEAKREGVGA